MEISKKNKAYVVTHTHWDREWRYPVWENRMLLVEFMDTLLDILDNNPSYNNFLMDGQSIMIKDYLEVRPNMEEKIRNYIRSGRISIGPWYTLPDLFPLDGESLSRNLLKGIRFSNELGGHLKVGYNSFGWGQTAQFPQIYKEFGFDFIIAAKNVSRVRAPKSEFLWEAPDGTRVITSRLGNFKRANFFMNAYIEIMYDIDYNSSNFRLKWGKTGQVFHNAQKSDHHKDYFMIENKGKVHYEKIEKGIQSAWNDVADTVCQQNRLIMNGSDFSTPQPNLTEILERANEITPDIEFISSSLDRYREEVISGIDKENLPVVKGELRDGSPISTSGNALATRSYLKRANKKLENKLYRVCEPLSIMSKISGGYYEKEFINRAIDFMLIAHAHDSINGVTQDKTANDVEYHIAQSEEICDIVSDSSMKSIIKNIDMSNSDENDIVLCVFNSYPFGREEIVDAYIDFPSEEAVWDFDVSDANGNKLEKQFISRKEVTVPTHDLNCRPWPFKADRYHVAVKIPEIPAGGYKTLIAKPTKSYLKEELFWKELRKSCGKELCKNTNILENKFLKVHVNTDGTVNITDKKTGKTFSNLNYFEDTGDIGDYWVYYPPYQNETVNNLGCNAQISLIENGPLKSSICASLTIDIPENSYHSENGLLGESGRSKHTKQMEIKIIYTLKKNEKFLNVNLEINNNVEDHRLRVLFDTRIKSTCVHSAGHYTTDHRKIEPEQDGNGLHFPESDTKPMQMFVGTGDEDKSFAIINDCFSEYEMLRNENNTLAITLFRSVRNVICTEFRAAGAFPDQKGGQSLGVQKYNYNIIISGEKWEESMINQYARRFNTPVKLVQTSKSSKGTLPLEHSFFSLDTRDLVVTAIKKAEESDSIVFRCFNPGDKRVSGILKLSSEVISAFRININEDRIKELDFSDSKIKISVNPNEIYSVEIVV